MAPAHLLLILLLSSLATSQFYSSYSYNPFYRTQRAALAPDTYSFTPSAPTFVPYSNYPSVSYVYSRFQPTYSSATYPTTYSTSPYSSASTYPSNPTFTSTYPFTSTSTSSYASGPTAASAYPSGYASSSSSSYPPAPTSVAAYPYRSARSSSYSSRQEVVPAWQGRVEGQASTRCHDGTLLPFRARCNKVSQDNLQTQNWSKDV